MVVRNRTLEHCVREGACAAPRKRVLSASEQVETGGGMRRSFIAAAAGFMAAASPCAAADMSRFADMEPARVGASVSAYLRIPFVRSSSERSRPHWGMRMSVIHSQQDSLTRAGQRDRADVLDLRLTGMASPTLLVAGRPVTGRGRRLNALGTAETIVIGVGGAAVLLVVAVVAGGGGFPDTCPTVGGQRDHCINP